MKLKTVFILMALCGTLLAAYSLRLHEHVLSADEAQVRHACRQLCKLGLSAQTGADTDAGLLGDVVGAFAGRACDAMDDHTPVLLECRDRLTAQGVSVATYRCVSLARALPEARDCSADL